MINNSTLIFLFEYMYSDLHHIHISYLLHSKCCKEFFFQFSTYSSKNPSFEESLPHHLPTFPFPMAQSPEISRRVFKSSSALLQITILIGKRISDPSSFCTELFITTSILCPARNFR